MPDGLYILTGPVQSGKTTSLMQWAEKNTVHGIFTPVINGKRMFMDANSKEQFAMEASAGETEVFTVGRFTFSKKGFDRAAAIIRNSIDKDGWLIVDEVGPLELRGEGFHEVLKETLLQRNSKMIWVVRQGLAEEVKFFFDIKTIVISKEDFSSLL